MSSSLSSNVILAKIKSKYGNRLTESDYQALLNCNSVSEIAAYLKNNTVYSELLSGVNENTIHRAQLESMIKQKSYIDINVLSKYELSSGQHFSDYILYRMCVAVILAKLMSVMTSKSSSDDYFKDRPILSLTQKHSKINIDALEKAKNYDDIIIALGKTEFADILKKYKSDDNIKYFEIGSSLYYSNFKKLFDIADKYFSGECKKELIDLFGSLIDVFNYIRIFRMKKNYNCTPDYIHDFILPRGKMSYQSLENMVSASTSNDVTSIFKSTSTGKKVSNLEYSYVDELSLRFKNEICRHYIRFSLNSPVVLMSYVFLMEVETSNLTHIIEGIRYGVDKDSLKKILIL